MIGRSRNSKRLADGLVAFDIIAAGGSHRDVAIALQGKEDAAEKWGQPGAYLEDWTRRLIHRATHLVDGGYMEFLTKKSV